ncbi:MAG: dimethylargininase [Planctomycetes bacterium]|nr:dimethylargininase [Planctomycetota bacterium]
MIAITHVPSPAMEHGQRTHIGRAPIDFDRAVRQHQEYCRLLRHGGAEVRTLDIYRDLPDCAFIEDTALVLDELALLASMGVDSRRAEVAGIESELRKYREVKRIPLPALIEGGDVLRVGRTLLVGLSCRTDAAGIRALEAVVRPLGYKVVAIPVQGCLHFKTACTALDDRTLLVNPAWVDCGLLKGFRLIQVPEDEPWAANVLRMGPVVGVPAQHVRTAEMVAQLGFAVQSTDLSEFAKAEAGITCLSLLVN